MDEDVHPPTPSPPRQDQVDCLSSFHHEHHRHESDPGGIREKKPERRFGGLKNLLIRMDDSFDDPMDELGNWYPALPSKAADDPVVQDENK